jgi:hypothetical protein
VAEQISKRRVTMTNSTPFAVDSDGEVLYQTHVATDYVPTEILDAYVADAKTRWALVDVGDEHDPGPGGDKGDTDFQAHTKNGG